MWICSWTPRCAGGLAFLGFVLIGSLEAGLGADLSGTMLPAHNSYRARHGVPALTWSNALASGAQLWANACTPQGGGFAHSPQAFSNYGENLSWGTGQSPDQAVASWYAESGRYDYNNALTSFNGSRGEVRHFTQLVWRGTSQVGCGVWNCSGQKFFTSAATLRREISTHKIPACSPPTCPVRWGSTEAGARLEAAVRQTTSQAEAAQPATRRVRTLGRPGAANFLPSPTTGEGAGVFRCSRRLRMWRSSRR